MCKILISFLHQIIIIVSHIKLSNYLAGIFSSLTLFSSVYLGKSECTPTNAIPASPFEPVLGMVETDGIDTVDNGFFS